MILKIQKNLRKSQKNPENPQESHRILKNPSNKPSKIPTGSQKIPGIPQNLKESTKMIFKIQKNLRKSLKNPENPKNPQKIPGIP